MEGVFTRRRRSFARPEPNGEGPAQTPTLTCFLQMYFTGLDRWWEILRVRFPKLDKALLKQPLGEKPLQLTVTGVPGAVTITWEDRKRIYSSPAPKQRK